MPQRNKKHLKISRLLLAEVDRVMSLAGIPVPVASMQEYRLRVLESYLDERITYTH